MKINEIKDGAKITVTVSIGDRRMDFETVAKGALPDGLLTELITYEMKPINFNTSAQLKLSVVIIDTDSKPYEWKSVTIKAVDYKGTKYSLLLSSDDTESINRRFGYRVYLGLQGVVQIGSHSAFYEVIVKDISEAGVAFIYNTDINLNKHTATRGRITFKDESKKFALGFSIVRKEQVDENRFLYGCALTNKSDAIRKYVTAKQIQQLQNKIKSNYIDKH